MFVEIREHSRFSRFVVTLFLGIRLVNDQLHVKWMFKPARSFTDWWKR